MNAPWYSTIVSWYSINASGLFLADSWQFGAKKMILGQQLSQMNSKWRPDGTKRHQKRLPKPAPFLCRVFVRFWWRFGTQNGAFCRLLGSKSGLFPKVKILSKHCTGHTDSRFGPLQNGRNSYPVAPILSPVFGNIFGYVGNHV